MIKKHLKSGILVITIAFALIASAFIVQSNVAREEKQVFAETNSNYSNWDSASVYVGGDKVLYNNNVYKAKWWTQGETPDTSEVWELSQDSPTGNWDNTKVYLGGDKVIYNNKIYKAKWWTQGETPDTSDVWEDTLEAVPNTNENTDTTAPVETPQVSVENQATVITKNGKKVVGYYPSWRVSDTSKLQYDVLTHVIYAFAIPTSDGGLRPLENPDLAKKIISEAHSNGVQVLLAVGGWSYNDVPLEPVFVSATETDEKLNTFVSSIVTMCETYGFDGIDIDWEHPRVDGSSKVQYENLMIKLSNELHIRGKILTSAVLSGATPDGNVYYDAGAHSDAVLNAVDWINVMAYDGGDGERHSSYDFAVNCGKYWKETRGLSADKVVLGVPFYARPSWASYGDILSANPDAYSKDTVIYNGMEAWYNGIPTIKNKTAYARDNLGGIMIWEVSQDTTDKDKSLLRAIGEEMYK